MHCEQKSHVEDWRLVRLRPTNALEVQEQIECQDDPMNWVASVSDNSHSTLLTVGDNFMIPAFEGNDEGVDFYVLQCTKNRFQVEEDFICPWGESFQKGDFAVAGTYYQKYGRGSNTFVYLERSVQAHVHASKIRVAKFPMILASHVVRGGDAVYKMTDETLDMIQQVLSAWWATDDVTS